VAALAASISRHASLGARATGSILDCHRAIHSLRCAAPENASACCRCAQRLWITLADQLRATLVRLSDPTFGTLAAAVPVSRVAVLGTLWRMFARGEFAC